MKTQNENDSVIESNSGVDDNNRNRFNSPCSKLKQKV